MAFKTEFIFTIIVYYLTRIGAQDNLSCRQLDFNDTSSINEFEECSWTPRVFVIKSYDDVAIEPFGKDVKYHLSNAQTGISCLITTQSFDLDETTEFYAMIYLNSIVEDNSEISIKLINPDVEFNVETVKVSTEWYLLHQTLDRPFENAQIEISGFIPVDAVLAIEYLHILNSLKGDEEDCEISDETEVPTEETEGPTTESEVPTTETEVTTVVTETTTDETEATTEETTSTQSTTTTFATETPTTFSPNPVNFNESSKWKILSFTFLLTTVIVVTASIYLFYLYKTALVTKSMLFKPPVAESASTALPRLTVATTNRGDQVIVGIEKIQYNGVKKI